MPVPSGPEPRLGRPRLTITRTLPGARLRARPHKRTSAMHSSRTLTGAAAAAALAIAFTATADDWTGVWRGSWENGHTTELTVVRIDDQGRALGAYCHVTDKGRTSYVDYHPEAAVLAQLDNTATGVLRVQRSDRHWRFRLDGDVVNMQFQFQDREPRTIELAKVEAQTCAARVHQLTAPPGATTGPTVADLVPEEPDHWAIGTWTTTYNGLTIELAVLDVVDRYARGIYCNLRDGPTLGFHDLHPDHGLRAKVSRKKLSFKIRDIRFTFQRTKDDDILERTRRQGGKTKRHDVHRTDEPACANRVTPPTT